MLRPTDSPAGVHTVNGSNGDDSIHAEAAFGTNPLARMTGKAGSKHQRTHT